MLLGCWWHFSRECVLLCHAAVAIVKRLSELFDRIDTDGSGGVDWYEFSEFCIEAGIVSTFTATKPLEFEVLAHFHQNMILAADALACVVLQYREQADFEVPATHSAVRVMEYFKDINLLAVSDDARRIA